MERGNERRDKAKTMQRQTRVLKQSTYSASHDVAELEDCTVLFLAKETEGELGVMVTD